jgi:hypothetical protein
MGCRPSEKSKPRGSSINLREEHQDGLPAAANKALSKKLFLQNSVIGHGTQPIPVLHNHLQSEECQRESSAFPIYHQVRCAGADIQDPLDVVLVHSLHLLLFEGHDSTGPRLQVLLYLHAKVHPPHFTSIGQDRAHKSIKQTEHSRGEIYIQDIAFRKQAMLGLFGGDRQLSGTSFREIPLRCHIQTQVLVQPNNVNWLLIVCPRLVGLPPKDHDFGFAHIYRQTISLTEILECVNCCLEAFRCDSEQL